MAETTRPMLFIAVPSGLAADDITQALLRVLVVPRFTEGSITQQGVFDWPSMLDEPDFILMTRASGGVAFEVPEPLTYVRTADSSIWNEFFGGTGGLVEPWRPVSRPNPIVVETFSQAGKVADTYHAVTTGLAQSDADADHAIRQALSPWASVPAAQNPELSDPPESRPVDFHRSVSMLREHPSVLTALGLVFELRVPVESLDIGGPEDAHALSVQCRNSPVLEQLVTSPWTRYEFGPRIFRPAPGPGSITDLAHGVLDLSKAEKIQPDALVQGRKRPPWALTNFDVDGARTALQQAASKLDDPETTTSLTMPAIRSIGISLLRPGRHAELAARAQLGAQRANAASMVNTELTADDLVLGYRVDIRKCDNNQWRSLCERDATYTVKQNRTPTNESPPTEAPPLTIGPAGSAPRAEEGQVKPFTAVRSGRTDLLTDEIVLHWGGWSLVLPVVKLANDPSTVSTEPSRAIPYQFRWTFTPRPGALPTLRFAHRYQMRVRIADLTGGGLTMDDVKDDDSFATPLFLYNRYDPVPPPLLHSDTDKFGTGAAIDRLVIRSDTDLTPQQLHAIDPDYPVVETRELLPPTGPLALIEQHGILDELTDEASWLLAQRAIDAHQGLPEPTMSGIHACVPVEPGGVATPLNARRAWSPAWPDFAPKSIRLTAAEADSSQPITIAWADDTLVVTLKPAEMATIELTSTLRDGIQDHFAFSEWLGRSDVPGQEAMIPVDVTMDGRNPAVTPARKVFAVHAVRRPLLDPVWNLPAAKVTRGEHETSINLHPDFTSAGTTLNTDSTGRLDVAAQWTDVDDNGPTAAMNTQLKINEHLFSTTIDRGDPPNLEIRHEFGDTRYRVAHYTLNAITRFRGYFKPDEPAERFHRSLDQPSDVRALSSARPAPLKILAVGPAFAWQPTQVSGNRIEHIRLGRRIRVELARPWFQTGVDERLGVIVAQPGSSPAPEDPVTQMGRDPLFDAPSTPQYPSTQWLRTTAGPGMAFEPTGLDYHVDIVPFAVSPDNDRWYADVELVLPDAAPPYNPFVQLALGRFQQHSLPGLELSMVMVTDKVPVLPDRRVVVERNGNQLTVTVVGVGPSNPNRVDATIEEPTGTGVAAEDIDLVTAGPPVDGVPAWMPVAGSTVHGDLGSALPSLTLPRTPGPLRLRLAESESLGGTATPVVHPELNRRNVFIDTIDIPAGWHQ
jgi:hypothetical protein